MLTSFARVVSGTSAARIATTTPVTIDTMYGVRSVGCTLAKIGGSSRSRPIAKNTRLCPSSKISTTAVRPAKAPMDISTAKACLPTWSKALASGASTLSLLYFTMPVTTSETST